MASSIVPQRMNEVMLFERNEETASLVQGYVEKAGLKLSQWVTLGTGWAELWQKLRPQILIIDLQLPKRDGLFCVEKLRGMDAEAFIIFTHAYQGLQANALELKALALGANSVIQKPFVSARFLTTLQRVNKKGSR